MDLRTKFAIVILSAGFLLAAFLFAFHPDSDAARALAAAVAFVYVVAGKKLLL